MDDNFYMGIAIAQAHLAKDILEVPIGCVIVHDDIVIGKGFNQRNTKKNTLYHAEIIAIDMACKYMGDWRLEGCTIYITLEPCPMCAGAILQSRIHRLVYGATSPKSGSSGTILNILDDPQYNHKVEITTGIIEKECASLMTDFFAELRRKK